MDRPRVERIIKHLSATRSRRQVLRGLSGGALGAALAALPPAAFAGAQEGTPAAEAEGDVSLEPLAFAPVASLPPAPALVGLLRVTFPPGAVLPLVAGDPSLALVYVEAGTLTVRLDATTAVFRAAAPGTPDPQPEEIAAGNEFTLGPGDSFVSPAEIPGEARNAGAMPVAVLAAVVEPAETDSATPES